MADPTPVASKTNLLETPQVAVKPVADAGQTKPAPGDPSADEVFVIQLRPYFGAEDKREPDPEGKAYAVNRLRARELVANGLVKYASEGEADKQIEADAQAAAEAVRGRRAKER